jgi:hypothetical protein
MSEEERAFNLNYPKDYGPITFAMTGATAYCPVSEAHNCTKCKVIGYEKPIKKGDFQVKEQE